MNLTGGETIDPARPFSGRDRVLVGLHAASLLVGLAVLLYANRTQWFFGDEWAFLGHRGIFGADRSLWEPHNEHWSTLPILIYRSLYALFGVRTYVPYVAVLITFHLAVGHLLWRLMRRAGVDLIVATGLATVFLLLGAGYDNLLWAFQIGFVGSVALGLVAILVVNHDQPFGRRDVAGWAAGIAALMCSGIGVTMVAIVAITVLLRRGLRDAALTAAVPGLTYAVWLALVGREGLASTPHTLSAATTYPDYIWTGLRSAAEKATGFPGAGPLIVLGLAVWLLRRTEMASGPAAPAFAGAIGAVLLFSIIAVGRTSLGVAQAEASRYVYIVIALALPAMALVVDEFAGRSAVRHGFTGFLLVLVVAHNLGVLRTQARLQEEVESNVRTNVLAASQLASSRGVILLNTLPDPALNPDIVVGDLRRMVRDAKLPSTAGIKSVDRVAAATVLQYAIGTTGIAAPNPPRIESVAGATQQRSQPGCVRVTPTGGTVELQLAGGDAMSLTLTSTTSGEVTGFLRIETPEAFTGAPRTEKVLADQAIHINVTASVDHLILRLPGGGPSELCGVQ